MPKNKIPIFIYHDINRELFDEELKFLSANGYRTLSSSELFQQNFSAFSKNVCLRFDDCRIDCRIIAHPYLKKYSYKAVMFVCPEFINSHSQTSNAESCGMKYCSWEQLREMVHEGTADIQNHSMEHELVFVSDRVIDFERPYLDGKALYPKFLSAQKTPQWGIPIYEYKWKGAVETEFLPKREISSACADFVNRNGGIDFFMEKSWKRKISRFYESVAKNDRGKYTKIDFDRESYIRNSLRNAQSEIFRNLGVTPEFFAPPVHSYDPLVIKILKEEGFKGLFNRRENMSTDKDGFIIFGGKKYWTPLCLPGRGRRGIIKKGINYIKRVFI